MPAPSSTVAGLLTLASRGEGLTGVQKVGARRRGGGLVRGGTVASRPRGFSLLEMLVALAVFGLVVIALLNLSGESIRTAAIVEERVLAGVIAENRAVEAAIEPLPALARATEGSERLGDREWRWARAVHATDDAAIVRVEVTVTAADSDRIAAETTLFRSAR